MATDFDAWACAKCGRSTRDEWRISPNWGSDMCVACRGFNQITDAEAKAWHDQHFADRAHRPIGFLTRIWKVLGGL